ncbi:hypothetical protein EDEG_00368 [Edhazardia aedis USNM 41457]|uniref:Ribosomal RNA-processing protein 42 n=1 Tax=Edhazardia aedis (strain USNM 41457) TaxID=1003232 RepID=J9DK82_EDHAE|nr:hypothetical protein EDEG_00368 [Edhazardia aedis USNM 41457]|eukprot:EJW01777.1 hypothetical protein EDEG_00368 [Edhazardia aedis USNM 41457]
MNIVQKLSQDEKTYTQKAVKKTRINGRSYNEERKYKILSLDHIVTADGSIKVSKCESVIEVSMKFKENSRIINSCLQNEITENKDSPIELIGDIKSFKDYGLANFITKNKIFSMVIETTVINDDGNIYDLFYFGLNKILLNIKIDTEFCKNVYSRYVLPISYTYAVFGNHYIVDPDFIEENSCDSLVHILKSSEEIVGIIVEKCKSLDPYVLAELITK